MLTPLLTFGDVLDAPGGHAVLERHLPDAVAAPGADLRPVMLQLFLPVTPGLRDDPEARQRFWADVDEVMSAGPVPRAGRARRGGRIDSEATRASAPWEVVGKPTRWGLLEVALRGPSDGNPFVDVELSAEFRCGSRIWTVGGFYDGDGVYRLRALAEEEGVWQFVTTSTSPALDGVRGEVTVGPATADAHGPVRVDGFHFSYADGTRYRPWGTTAYAWNHQRSQQQEATLADAGLLTVHEAPDVPLSQALRLQHR